jgi:L-glyceraldehyde 3-phosphate reductase
MLPPLSLGCWQNFGAPGTDAGHHASEADLHANARKMLFTAFDHGITHFDLANNYGPPPGAAEERIGRIIRADLAHYRDELIIGTKAGFTMWPGPYGVMGSRKSLLASLEQSLKRLKMDYVDLFYSHRPDFNTPLEETLGALDSAVKQGKAIYAGISNYDAYITAEAMEVVERMRFPRPIVHQAHYSMLNRWVEGGLLTETQKRGLGVIAFCPLEQGLLTNKYLKDVPGDSRASHNTGSMKIEKITPELRGQLRELDQIARDWGGSMVHLALKWVLRDSRVTSALIGASRPDQIIDCCRAIDRPALSEEHLRRISAVLSNVTASFGGRERRPA